MSDADPDKARLEQASLWWLRLREDNVPAEEINAWLEWCQRDSANLQAFEKIESLGGQLGGLDVQTRASLLQELDAELAAPEPPRRRRSWTLALAAGLAALAVYGGMLAWRAPAPEAQQARYATVKAQSRELKMSDGSQVALGAASHLIVDYSSAQRALRLDDGEAYFQVAHNPHRPFVVSVGSLTVTAVGTAFNIRKTGPRVEVVVTQGVVDVARREGTQALTNPEPARLPEDGVIRVAAGQRVVADEDRRLLTVSPADRDAAIAWREGRQQFVDENLAVVVANLNRYARNEVQLGDASLEQLRYTGSIVQGRESEWLAAVEKVFPISAQQQADGRVLLYRRGAVAPRLSAAGE
ncbi:FecR family protein [Solimonas aquatica]|uniref:FecR family protein n=1 Tax=Solimonas aquatica TaxID=489703 RepID=A0A1H9FV33_9GAMM|nr:FecR domain-containing protein [Solimonas aquatica]SEQ41751.1 FecR family protein [Solimonas aquatica]